MNKIKWNLSDFNNLSFDGYSYADINEYKLRVTDNGVFIWWCCILNNDIIDSSYNKNNPQSMSIKEAKESAEKAYLKHYLKDMNFPTDL